METTAIQSNSATIAHFYNVILNERKLEDLKSIISENYENKQWQKGLEGFTKGVHHVLEAFSDAHWTIDEMVAEGNRVMVKQQLTGTHSGTFQEIPATGKTVCNDGFAVYYFEEGKIVSHQIQTDRLGFLQQLGVLSAETKDSVSCPVSASSVYFVDKFHMPAHALDAFLAQTNYNRDFIRKLSGFIEDAIMVRNEANEDVVVMTFAHWASEDELNKAKAMVREEYQRINFDPHAFMQKLNISLEREQYCTLATAAK